MEFVAHVFTYLHTSDSYQKHNGIAAYAWKDHFLEHKQAIDDLVDKLKEQASTSWIKLEPHRSSSTRVDDDTSISAQATTKKVPASVPPRASAEPKKKELHVREKVEDEPRKEKPYQREESESRRSKSTKAASLQPTAPVKKAKEETNGKPNKPGTKEISTGGSSRRTLNSLSSTPAQTLLALIPAGVPIDSHTGLPAAPSRSPSPPPYEPTHKYTEQDAVYFFKRIAYDLKRDSDLTKANLCDILGEKVCTNRSAYTRKTDLRSYT